MFDVVLSDSGCAKTANPPLLIVARRAPVRRRSAISRRTSSSPIASQTMSASSVGPDSEEEMQQFMEGVGVLEDEMKSAGAWLFPRRRRHDAGRRHPRRFADDRIAGLHREAGRADSTTSSESCEWLDAPRAARRQVLLIEGRPCWPSTCRHRSRSSAREPKSPSTPPIRITPPPGTRTSPKSRGRRHRHGRGPPSRGLPGLATRKLSVHTRPLATGC
jgi:hypothetical protein